MCMIKSIELNISTYFSNKSISISYFAMFFLFFFAAVTFAAKKSFKTRKEYIV